MSAKVLPFKLIKNEHRSFLHLPLLHRIFVPPPSAELVIESSTGLAAMYKLCEGSFCHIETFIEPKGQAVEYYDWVLDKGGTAHMSRDVFFS